MRVPPSYLEYQRLLKELKELDAISGHEYNARKYQIIHDLAEARFYDARSYFIAGLDNPDPDYRMACISALITHWRDGDAQLVAKLLEMAESDPDAQVRDDSVASLGTLKVQEALPALKRIVEDHKEDMWIRNTAFQSMLQIPGHPTGDILEEARRAECHGLLEELKRLDALPDHVNDLRKDGIIQELAATHCYEAKPYLIAGLENPEPQYRQACIWTLTLLQLREADAEGLAKVLPIHPSALPRSGEKELDVQFTARLLVMAEYDSNEQVKDTAILSLGRLKVQQALPQLKEIVENHDKYPGLWKTAYLSILQILGRPSEEFRALVDKFEPDSVDKDLLQSIPDRRSGLKPD